MIEFDEDKGIQQPKKGKIEFDDEKEHPLSSMSNPLPQVLEPKTFGETLMQMIKGQAGAATDPNSAASAFKRALERSTLEGALNISEPAWNFFNKLEGKEPENLLTKIPASLQPNEADLQHPWAVTGGNLAGYALPFGVASKTLGAIPYIGGLLETEGSGIAGRLFKNAIKDFVPGMAVSAPGERVKGGLEASAVGPIAREIPAIAETAKDLFSRTKNAFNISSLEKSAQEAAQGDVQAKENLQNYHEEVSNQEQQAKEAIQHHLGVGENHDVNLATRLRQIHEETKQEGSKIYDKLDTNLKAIDIPLENPREVSNVSEEIRRLSREIAHSSDSEQIQDLSRKMDELRAGKKLVSGKSINARDLLTQYRVARDTAGESFSDAKNADIQEPERLRLLEKGKEMKKKAEYLKDLLSKNIGDQNLEDLNTANSIWSEKVAPLYGDPTYYQFSRLGKVSPNTINKVAGPEEYGFGNKPLTQEMKGKKIIRDMIKSDPMANRSALGQLFSENPEKIHAPNEEVTPYLQQEPQLQQLKQNHAEAIEETQRAKNAIEQSKANEKRIAVGLEPHEMIKNASDEVDRLSTLAAEKNLSLKEKIKREKQLESAKKDLTRIKATAGIGAGVALGAMTGPMLIKKIRGY